MSSTKHICPLGESWHTWLFDRRFKESTFRMVWIRSQHLAPLLIQHMLVFTAAVFTHFNAFRGGSAEIFTQRCGSASGYGWFWRLVPSSSSGTFISFSVTFRKNKTGFIDLEGAVHQTRTEGKFQIHPRHLTSLISRLEGRFRLFLFQCWELEAAQKIVWCLASLLAQMFERTTLIRFHIRQLLPLKTSKSAEIIMMFVFCASENQTKKIWRKMLHVYQNI